METKYTARKYRYTIREAAEITGTSKSTVRRYLDQLSPADIGQEVRAGHAVILISEAGLEDLKKALQSSSTPQDTHQNTHQDESDASWNDSRTAELIFELKARIEAQERELTAKNEQIHQLTLAINRAQEAINSEQEATKQAQALHAAQLGLFPSQEAQEPPQDAPQPEQGTDTTQDEESAQEAPSAPTEPPTPEITKRATFRERLRYLFTGQ